MALKHLVMGLCAVGLAACSSPPGTSGAPRGPDAGGGAGGAPPPGTGGSPAVAVDASSGTGGAGGAIGSSVDAGGSGPEPADGGGNPGPGPAAGVGPSPACAAGAKVPAPDGYQMLMANGKMRKFLVRAPKGYDGKKPLALIFAFHGGGADGASFETRIAAIVTAVGERGIFVYPDELPPPGGGQISWSRDYKDDLVFIDAIVDWLKQNLCYDTARVFSWGQSSGAYFANTVGCHRPNIFRAVSSNGGGVRTQEFVGCANMPVAAWISNGAMDPSHLPDARKARDAWVMTNGCTMANPVKVSPDPCVSYQGCKSGFPVHYCENGGGHDIPAYAPMGIADFFFGNFDK